MIDPNAIPSLGQLQPSSPREQAVYESDLWRAHAARLAARVPVRFLRDYTADDGQGGWTKGEVAGFDPGEAERLEKRGIATRKLDAQPPTPAEIAEAGYGGEAVLVEFKRAWSLYNVGDKAGFDAATARWLRVKGIAEPAEPVTPVRRTLSAIRAAILGR